MWNSVINLLFLTILLNWSGEKVCHTDDEWRHLLGRERYCIMRKKATERAFTAAFESKSGVYCCSGCGLVLFRSDSQCEHLGYLAFREPIIQNHVWIKKDYSMGFCRFEVLCRSCDSHLGHVLRDSPTLLRYVINSISLEFHRD